VIDVHLKVDRFHVVSRIRAGQKGTRFAGTGTNIVIFKASAPQIVHDE